MCRGVVAGLARLGGVLVAGLGVDPLVLDHVLEGAVHQAAHTPLVTLQSLR